MPSVKGKTWFSSHRIEVTVAALGFVLLLIVLAPMIFVTVPPGSVGVLWLRLFGGTVLHYHYGQGLKVVMPWDHVYIYETRLRRMDQVVTSLSEDGLPVETAVTLRYRIEPKNVGYLYDLVGPDYETRLLEPSVTSEMSEVIIAHQAQDLYTLAHNELEDRVAKGVDARLHEIAQTNHVRDGDLIDVVGFTMRKVTLPKTVQAAIDDKVTAQQVAEQYDYILKRERLESERKAIEADGVRRFQEIVSSNISPAYLKWRGIDATLRLAESPNSKVVVIGSGPGGLPLILGNLDDSKSAPAPAPATPSAKGPAAPPAPVRPSANPAAKPSNPPPPAATARPGGLLSGLGF